MKKTTRTKAATESRRAFMRQAALGGAGVTAAAFGTGRAAAAATEDAKPITVPVEFEKAKAAALPEVDFPMSGAQVFARACKKKGSRRSSAAPGLRRHPRDRRHRHSHLLGRHEGSMCHAADAFCRATGEVAATSGTEGPASPT